MDAHPPSSSVTDRAAQRMLIVLVALSAVAALLPLFPVALVFRLFRSHRVTALLLGVLGSLVLPVLLTWRARPFPASGREPVAAEGALPALARWVACGAAAAAALAAVGFTAQAVRLDYVMAAQANTLPYLLLQPVAAAVFTVALALATGGGPSGAAAGPGTPAGAAVHAALLAAAALAATLFLAGGSGPVLSPAAWLTLKTIAAWLVLLAARRALAGLAERPRLGAAWAALVVAVLNLAGTVVVLGRTGAE